MRGQHAASALDQFSGEELYEPAYSEPPKGTQSHRTDTFVREVPDLPSPLLVHRSSALNSLTWRAISQHGRLPECVSYDVIHVAPAPEAWLCSQTSSILSHLDACLKYSSCKQ